jgi:hypothetical protein
VPGRRDDEDGPDPTHCGEHPERFAVARCPKCGQHACIQCWHPALDRCETCLRPDPSAAAPPIPWEDPAGSGRLRRWLDTLVTALQPLRTAPAFARREVAPAVRFALWAFLPLALIRGIIPYTHTMRFGKGFGIELVSDVSGSAIALDIARAMGTSLLVTVVFLAALTLPFVSLARAYGTELAMPAAWRVMLYRSWLVPMSSQGAKVPGLLLGLVYWGLPSEPDGTLVRLVVLVDNTLPMLLLLLAMRATARLAGGVGPLASFVIVTVPIGLLLVSQELVLSLLEPWLPPLTAAAAK